MNTQPSITLITRLAQNKSGILRSQVSVEFVEELLTTCEGYAERGFRCSAPGCPIRSRDAFSMFAIDPWVMADKVVVVLCKAHANQAVTGDRELVFAPLAYALARVHQWITGNKEPLIDVPSTSFHGLSKPRHEFDAGGKIGVADMVAPEVFSKRKDRPLGERDP